MNEPISSVLLPELSALVDDIKNRPRNVSYLHLAEACGASESWVSQFARGLIPNPGYARVVKMREYLAKAKG